jgi:exopolyphosphatase/guanosine-5'-triphosphate,3'-diphosphate pyrophosphatase
MGSVRLTERHLHGDPPATGEIEAVRQGVSSVLSEAELAVPEIGAHLRLRGRHRDDDPAIALGLDRYDPDAIHRSWLRLVDAERALADLAAMTNVERAAVPVMAPGGDVIVAGAVILTETMRRFGFDRTLVSETDILWGLGLDTLGVR